MKLTGILVCQVQGVHVEGPVQCATVRHPEIAIADSLDEIRRLVITNLPHCRAVEMYHKPLGRIKGDRIGFINPLQPVPKFRTNKRAASVRGVHMTPHQLLVADIGDFIQIIERTRSSRAQSGTNLNI